MHAGNETKILFQVARASSALPPIPVLNLKVTAGLEIVLTGSRSQISSRMTSSFLSWTGRLVEMPYPLACSVAWNGGIAMSPSRLEPFCCGVVLKSACAHAYVHAVCERERVCVCVCVCVCVACLSICAVVRLKHMWQGRKESDLTQLRLLIPVGLGLPFRGLHP